MTSDHRWNALGKPRSTVLSVADEGVNVAVRRTRLPLDDSLSACT